MLQRDIINMDLKLIALIRVLLMHGLEFRKGL